MNNHRIRLGSVTLLFVVVIVCAAVISLLSAQTARADLLLSEKYATETEEFYTLENMAQEKLAVIDASLKSGSGLPEGAVQNKNTINFEIRSDSRVLEAELLLDANSGYTITKWTNTGIWEINDSIKVWNNKDE
ncbi:MAG: hypothetical protein Q4C42_04120 [Clostridia bacterium]|nr:hypothetical protein [Clostridia bacterium]